MFPVVPGCVEYQKGFRIYSVNVLYWVDSLIFLTDEGCIF